MAGIRRPGSIRDGMYFEDDPCHPYAHAAPKAIYRRSFPGLSRGTQWSRRDLTMDTNAYQDCGEPDMSEVLQSWQSTHPVAAVNPRIVFRDRLYFMPEFPPSKNSSSYSSKLTNLPPSYRCPEDLLEPPAKSYSSLSSSTGGYSDRQPTVKFLFTGMTQHEQILGAGSVGLDLSI
jgi:hypothetical protein